jgi:arylsulfatase A-like enzyme
MLCSVAVACAVCSCAAGEPTGPTEVPNILLVVVDTLRADHLGFEGYARPTSPRLDELANRATRYANARSTSSWTLPSHASLFTGRFPYEHGAHRFRAKPGVRWNSRPLGPNLPTLAEVAGELDLATAAFVANAGYLGPELGLGRGFDLYQVAAEPALELNRRVLRWLRTHPRFFLFVNYMDAHAPYNATPPAGSPLPEVVSSRDLLAELGEIVMVEGRDPPPGHLEDLIAQYDAGIANADAAIGELLDALELSGGLERTLVIVTSDHGEAFGEHAIVAHSKDLYEPLVRIPLLVKAPGQRRARLVDEPVSLADIPSLVVAALPAADRKRIGNRFPHRLGETPVVVEQYFSKLRDIEHPVYGARFNRVRAALYEGDYKAIDSSDGQHELYDLASDPVEAENLAKAEPLRLEGMLGRLRALRQQRPRLPRPQPIEVPEERLEQLEALGYR